jgi:glucose-1-phosphate thymidylyltransferase
MPGVPGFLPVAQLTVENMLAASVTRLAFVITDEKAAVIRHFRSGAALGAEIAYVCQETVSDTSRSAGLSDALDAAYPLARGRHVAFGMPDTIVTPRTCFAPLLAQVEDGADLVLGLFETDEPEKFGMVDVRDDGRVHAIVDKPERTELTWMWGIAAWSAAFGDFLHRTMAEAPTDFASVMNAAIEAGLDARAHPVEEGRYLDLGTPGDVGRAGEFTLP